MDACCLRYTSDTAHPQDIVPIYFIHSITQPLCDRPGCWCQAHKLRVVELLAGLFTNELVVAAAATFDEGNAD
ncbi:MAG TPA: hypothetical protein VKV19_03015 [Ktedonobacteraceae bacterium]|nr:hypothetical protein [Ktedonobacteraceae bacterium]